MTTRHLFLDLEDTVITPVFDGWPNARLLFEKVVAIQRIIEQWKPDFLHIFSFAIWNEAEKSRFNLFVRERLEEKFGMKLTAIPTVDGEIIPACCSVMGLQSATVDFQEMSNFWSKHEAFRLNIRHVFKNTHQHDKSVEVMLIDDAVINETFEWSDLRIRGTILNIDNLPEPFNAFNRTNHS